MLQLSPALAAAQLATTLEVTKRVGRHDAIVVGAGAAGGLAALMLTRAGLRVLVLDAGSLRRSIIAQVRDLVFSVGRGLFGATAPRVLSLLLKSPLFARRQRIQSRCYAWGLAPQEFVDDVECPYVTEPDHPFVWIRSRQLGGRVVIPGHGQQYYRLADSDFFPGDGQSPPWPLRPGELDPWYAMVERLILLAGARDDLGWLPNSELTTILKATASEAAFQKLVSDRWPTTRAILGRFAKPFNSLEAAAETGLLSVRSGAVVREIQVGAAGRVQGVVWTDDDSRTEERSHAPLVFLCASALESTRILLLSKSPATSGGLGASSGVLGRYLMDHIFLQALGIGPPLPLAETVMEKRCIYLPRFDARGYQTLLPTGRGFGVQVTQVPRNDICSSFSAASFGEMIPRYENRVLLDPNRKDAWGIPTLRIECRHGSEDLLLAHEQCRALKELAELAGVKLTQIDTVPRTPGSSIHECGTARMGNDPASSVVDPHNECWESRGLYVTDGACFPSQGTQNPLLTILALTARACDHAVRNTKTC